jgi:hypothetical protein
MIAPRVGLTWAPFEGGKTVFRGGLAVLYDKQEINIFLAYIGNVPDVISFGLDSRRPSLNPYCFGNALCSSGAVPGTLQRYLQFELAKAVSNFTLPSLPAPGTTDTVTIGGTTLVIPAPTFLGPGGSLIAAPVAATTPINPHLTVPGTIQASGGAAHQFSDRLNASGDFVYNRGFRQIAIVNVNVNPVTLRPPVDPRYTELNEWNNSGLYESYSLRFQSAYRTRRGDSFSAAYTLGWAYDNSVPGSQFTVGSGSAATNPFDLNVDWGPSIIDARHILNVSGNAYLRWGIRLSPIFSFVSALPYTAATSAAVVAGCPPYYARCYPSSYTKNSLRGVDTVNLSARLSKEFKFGEKYSLTLLTEGYNTLNRVNYTSFGTTIEAANFRKPTAASARRQLQLGFRFDF